MASQVPVKGWSARDDVTWRAGAPVGGLSRMALVTALEAAEMRTERRRMRDLLTDCRCCAATDLELAAPRIAHPHRGSWCSPARMAVMPLRPTRPHAHARDGGVLGTGRPASDSLMLG